MMKTLLALLLAAVLMIGGATAETGADAANRLGIKLLSQAWDGEHNQLISPVSLAYALDMAAAGAAGQTRQELKVCDAPEWNDALAAAGLKWANAAFVKDDLAVKSEYSEALKRDFDAELFALEDVDAVNGWVDEHTDHLIDHLVDEIDPAIRMLLLNAVAMDAEWAVQFDASLTTEAAFHAPAGDVTAQFMRATTELLYAEGPLGQAVRLDYRDSDLYMLVVLPEEGKMADALAALEEDPLGALGELTPREVALGLPKLDFTVENKLSEGLKAQGIRQAFTADADLSGISDEALMISDIIQKARLQVDEEGTRAAAVTEVIILEKGALVQDPPAFMNVDRPYIVLIGEEATGAVCFAGVVCDPTQK